MLPFLPDSQTGVPSASLVVPVVPAVVAPSAMAGMAQRLRARAVLRTAVNKRFSFILLHTSFFLCWFV